MCSFPIELNKFIRYLISIFFIETGFARPWFCIDDSLMQIGLMVAYQVARVHFTRLQMMLIRYKLFGGRKGGRVKETVVRKYEK